MQWQRRPSVQVCLYHCADGEDVVRQFYGTATWETNKRTIHLLHPKNAKVSVSFSAPSARSAKWAFSMSVNHPMAIKYGDTASGQTELSLLMGDEYTGRWNLATAAKAQDRSK